MSSEVTRANGAIPFAGKRLLHAEAAVFRRAVQTIVSNDHVQTLEVMARLSIQPDYHAKEVFTILRRRESLENCAISELVITDALAAASLRRGARLKDIFASKLGKFVSRDDHCKPVQIGRIGPFEQNFEHSTGRWPVYALVDIDTTGRVCVRDTSPAGIQVEADWSAAFLGGNSFAQPHEASDPQVADLTSKIEKVARI